MLKRALTAVFGNFTLKAIAVLISVGIWFYATQQLQDEMLVRAGVEVNPPRGYALLHQSVRDAQLNLSGPRSLISRLRDELAQAPLTLKRGLNEQDLENGWAELELDKSWLPGGLTERERVQLKVAGIRPQRVRIFASPRVEKLLPVEFTGSVETAPGFLSESPVCVPREVRVAGAAVALDEMQQVRTAEIALFDVRANVQRPVPLSSQRRVTLDNGEQIAVPFTTVPGTVTVHIRVSGEPEGSRAFDKMPVLWQLPPGFPYTPEYQTGEGVVSVTVTGPEGALKRLDAGDIRAFVDLSRLAREEIEPGGVLPAKEPVQLHLSAGFETLSAKATPANATLLLRSPAP